MKVRIATLFVVLLSVAGFDFPAQAAVTNQISGAFREFLRREGVRDPESGAILSVRPKVPRFDDNPPLECAIRKFPQTNQPSRYEILLLVHWRNTNEIHERLLFDAEPALLDEFSRQAKYHDLAPVRERRQQEARGERIREVTKGFLRYGMTREEIVTAIGDKWKPGPFYQKAGASEMRYDDFTLLLDPVLLDGWLPGLPHYDVRPTPFPLDRIAERSVP
jgi:hypothetical protein